MTAEEEPCPHVHVHMRTRAHRILDLEGEAVSGARHRSPPGAAHVWGTAGSHFVSCIVDSPCRGKKQRPKKYSSYRVRLVYQRWSCDHDHVRESHSTVPPCVCLSVWIPEPSGAVPRNKLSKSSAEVCEKAPYLAALPLTEITPAATVPACSSHMFRTPQRLGGSRWLPVFVCHRSLISLVFRQSEKADVRSGFWRGLFLLQLSSKDVVLLSHWSYVCFLTDIGFLCLFDLFCFNLPGMSQHMPGK